MPTVHYWPINRRTECESIKFAVEWGNKNTDKVMNGTKCDSLFTLVLGVTSCLFNFLGTGDWKEREQLY